MNRSGYLDEHGLQVDPLFDRIDALEEALGLLLHEVNESGNGNSRDYGWPKALNASRKVLNRTW